MKKKHKDFILVLLLMICMITIHQMWIKAEKKGPGMDNNPSGTIDRAQGVQSPQSIELLAVMENHMVKEKDETSETNAEDQLDYMIMFPNLYTEYIKIPNTMDNQKKVYLTFDDGPSDNTYKILDILDEYNIKATFFVIGGNITPKYEPALKRMVNEGHTIGVHCYSHVCNDLYCSIERFLEDFNEVYEKIYDLTGESVNVYRFPWGSNNGYGKRIKDDIIAELDRRGFSCYDWTTSADDAIGRPTAYSLKKNILKDLELRDHPIVLMHDGATNRITAKTLSNIIEMLQQREYEFGTLDQRSPYIFPW